MIRAFYDMELLVFTRGALVQFVAHPFASRHTPGHDLQKLGQEYFRHVECVIRDDLIEASGRGKTRRRWILATWGMVVLPGFLQFLIAASSLRRGANGIVTVAAPPASAVLALEPFS